MFADVAVLNKGKYTDCLYTYGTAGLDCFVGEKVIVPFGAKEKEGYIFALHDHLENNGEEIVIKDIMRKADFGHLNYEMTKTISWLRTRYLITYYDAINLFTPNGKPAKAGKEKEPYKDIETDYIKPDILTDEQKNAVNIINNSISNNENKIFLVHGVTSSGKTEVYMSAIEKAISIGKTAIMLVPEISLTSQTIERFAGRFGKENIAVLHSKLTQRERFDEWMRLKNGSAKIAIGARMGVFAPLDNLGLIIMDEEHEATYKADMSPKYDTVDVAVKRLLSTNGVLILGSATPSVVSYERAKEGIYTLIELKERYNKTPLPDIQVVDMREELKNGNKSIFSSALREHISRALDEKKQVILLQNRRGYSNFVSCRSCGEVMRCKECGISLTYHKSIEKMICHYCGKKFDVPKVCPNCKSNQIKFFGVGTEQVLEQVSNDFPLATVSRLDLDSVTNRTDLDNILKEFKDKKTDILVGTQLVSKGLDFDNVKVCGVISADSSLNIPDYRSFEKTYQLITQVAGRSGRGSEQGKVIVQTYEPDNFVFNAIKKNSYLDFYNEESRLRSFMDYPPFGDIILVNFTGEDDEECLELAKKCEAFLKKEVSKMGTVLSPKLSYNFKGKDSYRQYILVKSKKGERNKVLYIINQFINQSIIDKSKVNINVDVNPYQTF